MRERPIIFNSEMVRAILDGRKTVTRRPIKNVQIDDYDKNDKNYGPFTQDEYGDYRQTAIFCPFGKVWDRLYVRETFRIVALNRIKSGLYSTVVNYKADNSTIQYDLMSGNEIDQAERFLIDYDSPSIHMPKKYARIWLEITDIRVERIHDITEDQAIKEGFVSTAVLTDDKSDYYGLYAFEHFSEAWENIYGNWFSDNPWVWVIEFKRVDNAIL